MVSDGETHIPRDGFYFHGDVPRSSDHLPGNLLEGELTVVQSAEGPTALELVTEEELSTLIHHGVMHDIELNQLTYPPAVDEVVRKASEFYEVYLQDTNTDRVEVIDRYVAGLIDSLEELNSLNLPDEEVEEYVIKAHNRIISARENELGLAA